MPSGFRDRIGVYAVKKAIYDQAVTLFGDTHPEFLQSWGTARRRPDKYVEWLGGDAEQEIATLGRTHGRNETVNIESLWWVIVRGETEAAREAEEYLYDRLGELEAQLRLDPTLGGVALHCFLNRVITDTTDAAPVIKQVGHLAAAAVTFQASIRIRG